MRLEEVGFSNEYYLEVKKIMVENINNTDAAKEINSDLWHFEDVIFKEKVANEINNLNQHVNKQLAVSRKKNINEIIKGDNWVKELNDYTDSDRMFYSGEKPIFNEVKAVGWYGAIIKLDVGQLDAFRRWLWKIYPVRQKSKAVVEDASVLIELYKLINPDRELDLIKKANLGWLKKQIYEVLTINEIDVLSSKDN